MEGQADSLRVVPGAPLAAVSVDLDEIHLYRQIHGLGDEVLDSVRVRFVYDVAIERLRAWADAESIPITWFVVGRDLDHRAAEQRLSGLVARGDEIANHTMDHRYDLVRMPGHEARAQILDGHKRIAAATGVEPSGFRAPGYTLSDAIVEVLAELGYAYDSSVFPCPLYWGAKAAAMGAQRLLGRQSRSILGAARVLQAPAEPYFLGRPYWRRGTGPLEMPIQVTSALRLPYIGTALSLSGATGTEWLTHSVVRSRFVNLELHGIDALERHDGLGDLSRVQPDLRVGFARKLKVFSLALRMMRAAGFRFVTLREAARRLRLG